MAKQKITIEMPPLFEVGNYIDKPIVGTEANPDKQLEMDKHVRRRRGSLITAYVGKNGSGKSLTMVRDTIPDLLLGRKVLSTNAFLNWERDADPKSAEADEAWEALGPAAQHARPENLLRLPHPLWIPFTNLEQIMTIEGPASICADEVSGIADARETSSLPYQVANRLWQLRRAQVSFRWTAIDYSAADKRLRNMTRAVINARGFMTKYNDSDVWGTHQTYILSMFEGAGYNDFSSAVNRISDKQKPRCLSREILRLKSPRLSTTLRAYDSSAGVLSPADSKGVGMCMDCGGKRSVPRCSC